MSVKSDRVFAVQVSQETSFFNSLRNDLAILTQRVAACSVKGYFERIFFTQSHELDCDFVWQSVLSTYVVVGARGQVDVAKATTAYFPHKIEIGQ